MTSVIAWMIDTAGSIQGQIAHTDATAVARFNDVSTWKVTAPLTSRHALPAAAGWRVILADPTGVYGGPVDDAEISIGPDRKPTVTLSGYDELMWLQRTLAWPTPGSAAGSQADAYDVRTGTASTVIRAYVNANLGPGAQSTRRLPGLTLAADPVVGGAVTGRARFDPLLTLLQGLAITGAVGFRITPSLSLAREFAVYAPRDLTGPARFSLRLGNLRSLKWSLRAPAATTVIGGGRGEETAREFISVTSPDEVDWGRREDFYDYRSASDSDGGAELTEGATKRLTEQAVTRSAEVVPADTPHLVFGRDYWLGDRVTVDVHGAITMDAVIREVELTWSRSTGQPTRRVTPRIGDIGTTKSTREWTTMRDAVTRLARLERR